MRTLTAIETTDAILHTVFMRHNLPLYLRSDRGSQFESQIIAEICRRLDVEQEFILPYVHQSNGIVERANREILVHLSCLLYDLGKTDAEWDALIPFVQYIYNHTVNSSIGVSPFAMLYGEDHSDRLVAVKLQRALLPELSSDVGVEVSRDVLLRSLDEAYGDGDQPQHQSLDDTSSYLSILRARLLDLHERADRLQQSQMVKRNRLRNKDAVERTFVDGQMVLVLDSVKKNKLQPIACGPFKIIKSDPLRKAYKLQSIVDPSRVMDVHAQRIVAFEYDESDIPVLTQLARHDEQEQEVALVLEHKYEHLPGAARRSLLFHIQWANGSESWEPRHNVRNNDKAEEYMAKHGLERVVVEKKRDNEVFLQPTRKTNRPPKPKTFD
jgi:hypothetical protein